MSRRRHGVDHSSVQHGDRYVRALHPGFNLAAELDQAPGPQHFLAGLAGEPGPVGSILQAEASPTRFREALTGLAAPSDGCMWKHMQAQGAACAWAASRGETVLPEHLLLALLDQATPEVVALLARVGADADRVRQKIVTLMGSPPDLPRLSMPPPAPAGTIDRPALAISELPAGLWEQLCRRQEHLPVERLRRPADWDCLYHLEHRAANRLCDAAEVDDDLRCSVLSHHDGRVRQLASAAAPSLVERREAMGFGSRPVGQIVAGSRTSSRPRGLQRLRLTKVAPGWGYWFHNRAVNLNATWFRVSTLHRYWGGPARPSGTPDA